MTKWQSIVLADILINFTEKPSGPLASFTFNDLIVLLMSLADQNYVQGYRNFDFLNAMMAAV